MRRTTTSRLQKVIADNLVLVTSAVVNYDDRQPKNSRKI